MIETRIGSKRRRTVCRTRPVSKLATLIMLPIACVRLNLNAGIDCPHLAGDLPLGFRTSIRPIWLISLLHDWEVAFTTVIGWGRDAFFRSVSRSPCLLDLKTQVPKLALGTEACVPEDSGSDSPTSTKLMRYVRLVFFVVLPLLVVLDEVVRFCNRFIPV